MKQLLILAGGKGSRLHERLSGKPKSLIEIAGRPLLDYQITLAVGQVAQYQAPPSIFKNFN